MSPAQKQKAYRERKAAAARLAAASNPDTQPGQPFSVTPPADLLPATPPPADPFDLYADDEATSSPPAPARTSLMVTPAAQPPPATPAPTSHASQASSPSSDQQPPAAHPPASSEATSKPSSEEACKGASSRDSKGAASRPASKGNATVTGEAEGAGIAAKAGSAVVSRARSVTFPQDDNTVNYFELLPLDPVPGEVFDRCCIRLTRGDNWPDIAKDEDMSHRELWQRCGKYAYLNPEAAPRWQIAKHAEVQNHRRDVATIHARALQAGFDGVRKKKRTKTGADGKTETEETEEQYADPSMIRIALETADPATYGRGAGRQAPVTVNTTNAAFFGGTPPPGNLSGRFDD